MIVSFTDFGVDGPYLGQMRWAALREAPDVPYIDLMTDVPAFDPKAGAYLLAAAVAPFPRGTVVLGVVDPGVGGMRRPVALEADGRWYVGPDNGLFEIVARQAMSAIWWEIIWRPPAMSASFHGRDLFAPVAARIASGDTSPHPSWGRRLNDAPQANPDWPDDLPAIIYIDGYGNCMTGLRSAVMAENPVIEAGGRPISAAQTFSDVPTGSAFYYANALGLLEIAVNMGNAASLLCLEVGSQVSVRNL